MWFVDLVAKFMLVAVASRIARVMMSSPPVTLLSSINITSPRNSRLLPSLTVISLLLTPALGCLEQNAHTRQLRGSNFLVQGLAKGHSTCTVEPINFLFNDTVPYSDEMQKRGEKIFNFAEGCPETQSCLGLNDAEVWNARLGALGTAFPLFENFNLLESSPADGYGIIENAEVLFDKASILHVQGVTEMAGPNAIGSYLGVPHSKVSGIAKSSDLRRSFKIVGANSVVMTIMRREEWTHSNSTSITKWVVGLTYYPCSAKIKTFTLKFPDSTAENFIRSSQVPGMMKEVCERIQTHCIGEHKQFDSFDECLDYMSALPTLDPICQDSVGPRAVQGNCFMCKYLHQFMTPFEPEFHCYHSGKGMFDSKGTRKCAPTDCLASDTPSELAPALLFPPNDVTSKTYFKKVDGKFVETLVEPEVSRTAEDKSDQCTDEEANEIAASTILSLPMCMPSLSSGVVNTPCSQAVASLLGRFTDNGSLCRCKDKVLQKSVLLKTLQVDSEVLMQVVYEKLTDNVGMPACLNAYEVEQCQLPGSYRGKNGCKTWNFAKLEKAVYLDWGESAAMNGRITTDDLVATAECMILSGWQRVFYSADVYYTRSLANGPLLLNYPAEVVQVHPSLGPWERSHKGVLSALQGDQIRSLDTNGGNNCMIGTNTILLPSIKDNADVDARRFLLPVSYSTGSDLHKRSRQILYTLFPGLSAKPDEISLSNVLDKVSALHALSREDLPSLELNDMRKLIREVTYRSLTLDKLPYEDEKLGDALELVSTEVSGGAFIPSRLSSVLGEFRAVAYKTGLYQLQRILQESILSTDQMTKALQDVGLDDILSSAGPGNAYGIMAPNFDSNVFTALVDRLRLDECESKHHIETSGFHSFMMEHLRLSDFAAFKAQVVGEDSVVRTYNLASANLDPTVFENPLRFEPQRANLNQVIYFNGLQQDFEEHTSETGIFDTSLQNSLKRGCPGRSISMRVMKELAPLFFPREARDYTCHAGVRAWYGIKFESNLVRVRDNVELEVLKVDGKNEGKNLLVFLHDLIDHPLGWAKLIEKLNSQQGRHSLDYWSVVMPGWGGKSTPLEQCDWPRIGGYLADLLRQAKGSYSRVFLFGRGYGGYVAQYAAAEVGKDVLHGLITDALPPALHAAVVMSKPLPKLTKMLTDTIISDTVLASDAFPLETLLENSTWWDDAWKWEYRSFWRKTSGKPITCQVQTNWAVDENGVHSFRDFDAAKSLDPSMHMLTLSHELDLLKPEGLSRYGLKQNTPRPGIVHRFEQVLAKPDLMTNYYEDEPANELAGLVASFVDQTIEIRYSFWQLLYKPPDFHESAYKEAASQRAVTFYCYVLTFVIMLTGLIMETTIGPFLVGKFGFGVYLFAQVMAATINFGCFFAADLITLPLYTLGLFKLGYPEVTSKILAPLRHPEFFHDSYFFRGLSFLSGIAYVIHHSGGTLVYTVVSLHEMDPLSVGFLALAVGFQHLVVFIKYIAPNVHAFLLVALEIWFQFEAYYALTFATTTARVGICMLLTSHYIWFLHGNIALVMGMLARSDEDEEDEDSEKEELFESTCQQDSDLELDEVGKRRPSRRGSLHKERSMNIFHAVTTRGKSYSEELGRDDLEHPPIRRTSTSSDRRGVIHKERSMSVFQAVTGSIRCADGDEIFVPDTEHSSATAFESVGMDGATESPNAAEGEEEGSNSDKGEPRSISSSICDDAGSANDCPKKKIDWETKLAEAMETAPPEVRAVMQAALAARQDQQEAVVAETESAKNDAVVGAAAKWRRASLKREVDNEESESVKNDVVAGADAKWKRASLREGVDNHESESIKNNAVAGAAAKWKRASLPEDAIRNGNDVAPTETPMSFWHVAKAASKMKRSVEGGKKPARNTNPSALILSGHGLPMNTAGVEQLLGFGPQPAPRKSKMTRSNIPEQGLTKDYPPRQMDIINEGEDSD